MFEQRGVEDKISYLQGCIPLNQYNAVIGKYESYSQDTVDELIEAGKEVVRRRMKEGRDHWNYYKEYTGSLGDKDILHRTYKELEYLAVSMKNSGLETSAIPFDYADEHDVADLIRNEDYSIDQLEEIISQNGDSGISDAFSIVGRNIWDVIDEYPEIRIAHFEDKHHIYLQFWSKAKDQREFHERKGEYFEFPIIRKIDCRIHLDDQFIELRGRRERNVDREQVLKYIEDLFGNAPAINVDQEGLEISDETIRYFMDLPEFIKTPHASKAGDARSNWTSDSDVRDDPAYPDHRPHNYGNMVFNIDNVGRISFQLSADDDSFRVFKQKITPENHRDVVEYIWRNVNAANQ